jgi:hypothetical protein
MVAFLNKKFKDLTSREKDQLDEYLTRELWDKQKTSVECPICGGTITTNNYGSASVTDCSTPGCVHIVIRGL